MSLKREIEEEPEKQQDQQVNCFQSDLTTVVLLLFGFYFLTFAIVEFITNTQQSQYNYDFLCRDNVCSLQTDVVRFDEGRDVNIYLTVDIPQNHIYFKYSRSRFQLGGDNSNPTDEELCTGAYTNAQLNRTVSMTGKALNPEDKAIPCGMLPGLFPLGEMKVFYVQNGTELDIQTEGIVSQLNEPFKNIDPDRQWVNMTDPRFQNWMETAPSKQTKKLWGILKSPIIGSFRFQLRLADERKENYKLTLTDNRAEGGYDPPLCFFGFTAALGCFGSSIVSYLQSRRKSKAQVHVEDTERKPEDS